MVSTKRARSQRAFDSQALLSFLSWVGVLWSGCFENVVHFKRPRFSAAMEESKSKLFEPRSRGCPEEEDREYGYYAALEDNGEEEEGWDMLEGGFYVGTRIPTEVELRSPVEEKRGVATIVKSSSLRACAYPLQRQKDVVQERSQPTLTSRAKSWENVELLFTGIEEVSCQTEEIVRASSQKNSKDFSDQEKGVCYTETRMDIAGRPEIDATDVPEAHIGIAGGSDVEIADVPEYYSGRIDHTICLCRNADNKSNIEAELMRASAQILNINSKGTCFHKGTRTVTEESELGEVKSLTGCKMCPSNRIVKVDDMHLVSKKDDKNLVRTCSKGRLKPRIGSLTDHDFAELRGCIDLGFVFTEEDSLDLRATLPALEACYAVSQGAILPTCNCQGSMCASQCSPPEKIWRIVSPGDQPQQVKTRLRHWAQAVACTVRQSY